MLQELEEILADVREYAPEHHLGLPFLSAYQLAIEFADRHPNHPIVQQLSIGGAGTGEYQSLAQHIARLLSQSIRDNMCPNIEGGFISHENLERMTFTSSHGAIDVSTLHSHSGHSIFRYVSPLHET